MAHWPELLLGDIPTFASLAAILDLSLDLKNGKAKKRAAIIGPPCEDMKRLRSLTRLWP